MEVSFSYLGDVVTGVVGADDVLAVLVVTATFHLNINFKGKFSEHFIDQKHYQVLLDLGDSDLVGGVVGARGGLLPG